MFFDSVKKFFAASFALSPHAGGIDISDHAIKFFHFTGYGSRRRVHMFGRVVLEEGIVVSGSIKNKEGLASVLRSVKEKCGFSFAHVSLPEDTGYLFNLGFSQNTMPVADAIAIAFPEHVPLPMRETVFSYETVKAESASQNCSIVVSVFPRATIDSYAEVIRKAGCIPLSFEFESQAATRAIASPQTPTHAQMLVDCSADKTVISIVENNKVRFATSFPGNSSINDTAKTLGDDINRIGVYWHSRGVHTKHFQKIKSILLYGEHVDTLGLPDYLTRMTGIPCKVMNLHSIMKGDSAVPPVSKHESLQFVTAAGLALKAEGPLKVH